MTERRKIKHYDQAFKDEAVRLVLQGGLSVAKAASDLGVSVTTLYGWIRRKQGGGSLSRMGVASNPADLAKIRELEKQVKRLTMEREILKKAVAYFAEVPK